MKTINSLLTLLSLFSMGRVTFSTSIDSSVENGELLSDRNALLFYGVKERVSKGVNSQHLRALYEGSPCHNLYASLKYSQKEGSDSLSIALKLRLQSKNSGNEEKTCKKDFYPWSEVVGVLNLRIPTINGEKEVRFPFYVDLDEASFALHAVMNSMPLDQQRVIDKADLVLLDPSVVAVRISEKRQQAPKFACASVASYDPKYFEKGKVVAFAFPYLSAKQTIYGQKMMLSKQKYFRKYLEKDDNQTLVTIQVPNFSAETMTALLEYVHTGRMKQYPPMSWEELFKAAQAFEIDMLGGAVFVKRAIEAVKTHTPITELNVDPSSPFYVFIKDINSAVQNEYRFFVLKSDRSDDEDNDKLNVGDAIARIVRV